MKVVKEILGTIKSWRLWGGLFVLAVVATGGYLGYNAWSESSSDDGTVQTQLVPVASGSLVNDVSVTGALTYTTRETVTFGQQGFVADVPVLVGDSVSAGDALARLDAETIANLDRAVAHARIQVREAEEGLEDALESYTSSQVARAELDVANAQLELQNAQEELDSLRESPPSTLAQTKIDILRARDDLHEANERKSTLVTPTFQESARAQAEVAAARLALNDAEDDLEALLSPAPGDIVEAEAEVTAARTELAAALEALEALSAVTELELAGARLAVSDAELQYTASQEAIYELETWSVGDDILALQEAIDAAQAKFIAAMDDMQRLERNGEEAIQLAMDALDAAARHYKGQFEKWLGMDVSQLDGQSSPDEVFAANGISLEVVYGESYISELRSQYEQGILTDSPTTSWDEVVVHTRTMLLSGEVIVDCGNLEAGPSRACIPGEFLDAYDLVRESAVNLERVREETTGEIDRAKEAVAIAERALEKADRNLDYYITEVSESESTLPVIRSKVEALGLANANLRQAREDLAALTADPDPLEVESRQGDVMVAQARLAESLKRLSALTGKPDEPFLESKAQAVESAEADLRDAEAALAELMQAPESDLEMADREIELASANLTDAEEALALLQADPDPAELLVKQASVRVAQESLADAQVTLDEVFTVDQLDINLREADLVAAQAGLEAAIVNLERATLRAPFDGIVVSVDIEVGQQVSVNTQGVEIADPSIVEVIGSVDEIDVLFLQLGAQASVSLEALGTQILPGSVSTIANSGVSQQGVVTYPVTIRVDSTDWGQLPEGLSATAQIIIREHTDAILIPLQALYGTVQAPLVRVVSGEDIVERQVILGISDDFWIVVEEGLVEGEVVIMEVVGSSTSQFSGFGPGFRQLGGFGGGGGGPGGGGDR